MSLASEYKRQFEWRDWPPILNALPSLKEQTVIDLGCGVGDLAFELATRGARVIGLDGNEELLLEARSRQISNAEFRQADLRQLPDLGVEADGLWCSFAAAYFVDLPEALSSWAKNLKPAGWIAVTEIDDLFGHEPLTDRTKELLHGYAEESLAARRYDFRMGRKLTGYLEKAGFSVSKTLAVKDQELSFDGPAGPEVIDAWRARFARMKLLRDFCGPNWDQVQQEYLECLYHPDHKSLAKVCCCIATKGKNPGTSSY